MLVPEDRASDTSFSVPVGLDDVDAYAGHVAAELATAAGLWTGMGSAPVDDCLATVIDNGDASVVFARSLARVACGPPLPLDDALVPGRQLPVPPGAEPAPDARRTAIAHAERMFAGTPQLHLRAGRHRSTIAAPTSGSERCCRGSPPRPSSTCDSSHAGSATAPSPTSSTSPAKPSRTPSAPTPSST